MSVAYKIFVRLGKVHSSAWNYHLLKSLRFFQCNYSTAVFAGLVICFACNSGLMVRVNRFSLQNIETLKTQTIARPTARTGEAAAVEIIITRDFTDFTFIDNCAAIIQLPKANGFRMMEASFVALGFRCFVVPVVFPTIFYRYICRCFTVIKSMIFVFDNRLENRCIGILILQLHCFPYFKVY